MNTKIISIATKQVYEIFAPKSGENYMPCPECSMNRKKQRAKCFSWNNEIMQGKCHNCEASFVLWKPIESKKQFAVPEWKNNTNLSDRAVKWFEGRMIKQEVLRQMRIYSYNEFMPQTSKEESVVCFPYFHEGKLINIKYRDGAKNFKLVKDAELILYNLDAVKNSSEIIIVEGEIDCLSYLSVNLPNCVSVPNGAGSNLQYLDDYIELFDSKERIYIATDNDSKGIELREELIRRFGSERCLIVNFKDKKDANEYLCAYGGLALQDTIKHAIEIPVSGIIKLSNQYDEIYNLFINGLESGCLTGIKEIDEKVTWELGRLAVITGIPSHGKSEWLDFILMRLNIVNQWRVAYFSPENYPVKYHYAKLCSKLVGKEFKAGFISDSDYEEAFDYIKSNFFFIYPEDNMGFDNIIEKAKYLVRKRGINVLVIDPYNKIEHLKERGESETEYISRFLDKLVTFGRTYNVLVFLVAHPRKMDKMNGKYEVPNLYDINGSANFYNKCDYGISIYRMMHENEVYAHILKVKFKHLGSGGAIKLKYDYRNGRYENFDYDVNQWDYSNYLHSIKRHVEIVENKDFWNSIETIAKDDLPF